MLPYPNFDRLYYINITQAWKSESKGGFNLNMLKFDATEARDLCHISTVVKPLNVADLVLLYCSQVSQQQQKYPQLVGLTTNPLKRSAVIFCSLCIHPNKLCLALMITAIRFDIIDSLRSVPPHYVPVREVRRAISFESAATHRRYLYVRTCTYVVYTLHIVRQRMMFPRIIWLHADLRPTKCHFLGLSCTRKYIFEVRRMLECSWEQHYWWRPSFSAPSNSAEITSSAPRPAPARARSSLP